MNKINKIDSGSYGLCLFSLSNFSNYLKINNIRSGSLIDFFNKNSFFSDDSLRNGIILPLNTMSFNQFYFDFFYKENQSSYFLPNNWSKIHSKGRFNLEIKNNDLWICGMDVLNFWEPKKFNQPILGYSIKSGCDNESSFYFEAQKIQFPTGKYVVDVYGYKRTQENSFVNDDEDYGIGFELEKVDNFNANKNIPKNIEFDIVE